MRTIHYPKTLFFFLHLGAALFSVGALYYSFQRATAIDEATKRGVVFTRTQLKWELGRILLMTLILAAFMTAMETIRSHPDNYLGNDTLKVIFSGLHTGFFISSVGMVLILLTLKGIEVCFMKNFTRVQGLFAACLFMFLFLILGNILVMLTLIFERTNGSYVSYKEGAFTYTDVEWDRAVEYLSKERANNNEKYRDKTCAHLLLSDLNQEFVSNNLNQDMNGSVPKESARGEEALIKGVKVLAAAGVKEAAKAAFPKVAGAALMNIVSAEVGGMAAGAVAEAGFVGVEYIHERIKKSREEARAMLPERKKETKRLNDLAPKFSETIVLRRTVPYLEVDGGAFYFKSETGGTVTLHKEKREGLYGMYTYKDSNPALEEMLSEGKAGSFFLSIEVAEYSDIHESHIGKLIWLRKLIQEVPESTEKPLIFRALTYDPKKKFKVENYAVIALFERTEAGNKKKGEIRLKIPFGFEIYQGKELLQCVKIRTEQEVVEEKDLERQTRECAEMKRQIQEERRAEGKDEGIEFGAEYEERPSYSVSGCGWCAVVKRFCNIS